MRNCADLEALDLANEIDGGRLRVGIVSCNLPRKGIEHFARLAMLAAERRPELQFIVIGPSCLWHFPWRPPAVVAPAAARKRIWPSRIFV